MTIDVGGSKIEDTASSGALVSVRNLTHAYPARRSLFGKTGPATIAVNDVSFDVIRGETLALVGESGSGKTTTGRAILRLIEPTSGSVKFDGTAVLALEREPLRRLRRRMQVVFQDPQSSLDPRMRIGRAVREGIEAHEIAEGAEADRRVARALEEVGLRAGDATKLPHEFSGGQRQRIAIARALAVEPEFVVLDEAVSALDVTVQAQVLALLTQLQRDRGLTYLFIAHNLAVVERIATRVAVMYVGRIVELADAATLYAAPQHGYTKALLSAVPVPDPRVRKKRVVWNGQP
ncbi:MAG TPA: ATP-binding cassette domain-containing protein [Gemmatimonadaceae bacterium]|jgi:peptide/nickel transport system ATP-binding protein/oligopeptide transport system ATP-binding protein